MSTQDRNQQIVLGVAMTFVEVVTELHLFNLSFGKAPLNFGIGNYNFGKSSIILGKSLFNFGKVK